MSNILHIQLKKVSQNGYLRWGCRLASGLASAAKYNRRAAFPVLERLALGGFVGLANLKRDLFAQDSS